MQNSVKQFDRKQIMVSTMRFYITVLYREIDSVSVAQCSGLSGKVLRNVFEQWLCQIEFWSQSCTKLSDALNDQWVLQRGSTAGFDHDDHDREKYCEYG